MALPARRRGCGPDRSPSLPSRMVIAWLAATPATFSTRPFGQVTSIAVTLRRPAQAERQRQLALRAVARAGLHHAPRLAAVRPAGRARVRRSRRGSRLTPSSVTRTARVRRAAVVAQQPRRAVVGGDHQVEVAVVVEVAVGGAARRRPAAGTPGRRGSSIGLELLRAQVPEQVRPLRVGDLRLHGADVVGDVAVGGEDVEQAVEVDVEEEAGERQRQQRGLADRSTPARRR